jgi:catalase
LYRLFDEGRKDRLTTRIAGGLGQARKEVQLRQVCHFFRADPDYGTRVAKKLGIDLAEFMKSASGDVASAVGAR